MFEAIIFIKMFGPHPLEKYCNALVNSKTPRIATLSPWYTVVGHIPHKIAAASALFLARKGTICCEVTGTRCYSEDLPQCGLEIPIDFLSSRYGCVYETTDSAPRA